MLALASSCIEESANACHILESGKTPTRQSYPLYNDRISAEKESFPSSREFNSRSNSPQHSYRSMTMKKPITLRVVGIYVLFSLRLIRVLRDVRTYPDRTNRTQQFSSAKKNKKKLSVYEESYARKFGYNGSSESATHLSLLEVIKSDRTESSSGYSSFITREEGRERGRERGRIGGDAHDSLVVIRETMRSMSDAVTGLRAKELLLFVSY